MNRAQWFGVRLGGAAVIVTVLLLRGGETDPAEGPTVWPAPEPFVSQAPDFEDFVGAETCGSCHASQYAEWAGSTHGRAGGEPGPDVLITAFDRRPLRFADGVVYPFREGNQYGFEVHQDGHDVARYMVDGVIGGGHMIGGGTQGFVSNAPDGTVRFLAFDYIRAEGEWFCNTNSRSNEGWIPIRPTMLLRDCGDWPPNRVLGSEPRYANCQGCHGSQIRIAFDPDSGRYQTDIKSLRINCESCHGPGREHVERANNGTLGTSADLAILTFATVDKDSSLGVCFQCHALKGQVETGYLPGAPLEQHYSLKLPLIGDEPLFPDGRIRTFAYQQNHVASDCYLNGSMTCVDCHDPHGNSYRDIFNQPLESRFSNGQCLSCHPSKSDVSAHTNHPATSRGSTCVNCHMPFLQHQELGNTLRFARSDHTIPIPRPGFDEEMGVESACAQCHQDVAVDDLRAQTAAWYGELKPHKDIVSSLLQQTYADAVQAAIGLLPPEPNHPLAQVAALNRYVRDYLSPNMSTLDDAVVTRLQALGSDPDIDVRATALAALHLARGQDPDVRRYLGGKLREVEGNSHDLRGRWAVILGSIADGYKVAGQTRDAVLSYRKALEVQPEHPRVLLNLAIAYNDDGDYANATRFFRRILQSDSTHALAWLNLGVALEGQDRIDEAAGAYRNAIAANPVEPLAHFNLGNYHLRREEYEQAIASYEMALRYDPGLGRAYYYLARAFVSTNQPLRALTAARRAAELDVTNQNAPLVLQQLEEAIRQRGN